VEEAAAQDSCCAVEGAEREAEDCASEAAIRSSGMSVCPILTGAPDDPAEPRGSQASADAPAAGDAASAIAATRAPLPPSRAPRVSNRGDTHLRNCVFRI
jgi:hypothetical protein